MTPQEIRYLLTQSPLMQEAMQTDKKRIWQFLRQEVASAYATTLCVQCGKDDILLETPYRPDLCIECLLALLSELVDNPITDKYRDKRSFDYDASYDRRCKSWEDLDTIEVPDDYDEEKKIMSNQGALHVWPGVIIETTGGGKLIITLGRITDETPVEYARRCEAIASYAISLSPKSEPSVINYDDTSKYKKIGENAYELITPYHQPTEETVSKRDTHFAGSAEILWNMLHLLYLTEARSEADVERYEKLDIEIIAQYAYDVGEHVYNHTTEAMTLFSSFEVVVEEGDIPDLPTWPPSD